MEDKKIFKKLDLYMEIQCLELPDSYMINTTIVSHTLIQILNSQQFYKVMI